jgi:hypothetical protein
MNTKQVYNINHRASLTFCDISLKKKICEEKILQNVEHHRNERLKIKLEEEKNAEVARLGLPPMQP